LPEVTGDGLMMGFVDLMFKWDWFLMGNYNVSHKVEPRINSRDLLVSILDSWME
jgi:hypothetical protein